MLRRGSIKMENFNHQQIDYIESSINDNIYLEACPGSGKTEVIAAKVVKEMRDWTLSPGGIALLSFSNSATDELFSRVQKYSPDAINKFPHFIGTFDSFIFKFLISPNSKSLTNFEGIGFDNTLKIIETTSPLFIQTKYKYNKRGHIKAHHYRFDRKNDSIVFNSGDSDLDRVRNSTVFENWQTKDLIETKLRLFKAGLLTYDDVLFLAFDIFNDDKYKDYATSLSQRFPLIIVDECQDLSYEHLYLLQGLRDLGVRLHFIGDLEQSIYGFRDVNPNDIIKFIQDNNFVKMPLKINYRSCQQIIDLCSKITLRGNVSGRFSSIESPCFVLQYDKTPLELIEKIEHLCLGYNNNVIVARGHSLLKQFTINGIDDSNVKNLARAIQFFASQDTESIKNALQLFSLVIRSNSKHPIKESIYNCPSEIDSTAKWRMFIFDTLEYLIDNKLDNFELTWSGWCKKANPVLSIIYQQPFVMDELRKLIEEVFSLPIRSPSGLAKSKVSESISTQRVAAGNFKFSTIHRVKGETHDVTILLSAASNTGGSGSHWKQWINDHKSESARFAYVASSRPKYRLIWGVKTLKQDEIDTLNKLGFNVL